MSLEISERVSVYRHSCLSPWTESVVHTTGIPVQVGPPEDYKGGSSLDWGLRVCGRESEDGTRRGWCWNGGYVPGPPVSRCGGVGVQRRGWCKALVTESSTFRT